MKRERSRRDEPVRPDRTLHAADRTETSISARLLAVRIQQHEERITYDEGNEEASPIQTERAGNTEL